MRTIDLGESRNKADISESSSSSFVFSIRDNNNDYNLKKSSTVGDLLEPKKTIVWKKTKPVKKNQSISNSLNFYNWVFEDKNFTTGAQIPQIRNQGISENHLAQFWNEHIEPSYNDMVR